MARDGRNIYGEGEGKNIYEGRKLSYERKNKGLKGKGRKKNIMKRGGKMLKGKGETFMKWVNHSQQDETFWGETVFGEERFSGREREILWK